MYFPPSSSSFKILPGDTAYHYKQLNIQNRNLTQIFKGSFFEQRSDFYKTTNVLYLSPGEHRGGDPSGFTAQEDLRSSHVPGLTWSCHNNRCCAGHTNMIQSLPSTYDYVIMPRKCYQLVGFMLERVENSGREFAQRSD